MTKDRLLSRAQIKRICRDLGGYPKAADAIGVNASTNASKTAMMSRWAKTGLPSELEIRLAELDPAYIDATSSVKRWVDCMIEDAERRPDVREHLETLREKFVAIMDNWESD